MQLQFFARLTLAAALVCSPMLHAEDTAPMASVSMLTGACVACHGPSGNSIGPATPSLAGLPATYFIGAMLSYKHAADLDAAEAIVDGDATLEDVSIFQRQGTIMGRIAGGYTLDEIKAMADYFAGMSMVAATQEFDADRVSSGEALHADNCEKCHEDGGRSTLDDMVPLAGQWVPYLQYSLADFHSGTRGMPKKMRSRLKDVHETTGEDGLTDLIHYYASQQ